VHQQVPAIRRGRDVVHEQFIQAIIRVPVCQREVQRPLHLSAQLTRLVFSVPAVGLPGVGASVRRPCGVWVNEWRRLPAIAFAVFQQYAPLQIRRVLGGLEELTW